MNSPFQRIKTFKQVICLCCLSIFSFQANADKPSSQDTKQTIYKLYHSLNHNQKFKMSERLDTISAQFLGKTYKLGALGEGPQARFDQAPAYRTDAFDCDTYVTTVLALALANNEKAFKQCLRKIRYKNGHRSFIDRNHFTSVDWNLNNQQQGYIKDITESFLDENNKPVSQIATAVIDKPSWYQHLTIKNIRLNNSNRQEQEKRLAELKAKGSKLSKVRSNTPYIPLTALFNQKAKANQHLFSQIPHAAIIEIVRPDWDIHEKIGTNLNISHLGFAFWKKGVLFFREASSAEGKVIDIPLADYLRQALTSPSIKGINVQIVVPETPLSDDCVISG